MQNPVNQSDRDLHVGITSITGTCVGTDVGSDHKLLHLHSVRPTRLIGRSVCRCRSFGVSFNLLSQPCNITKAKYDLALSTVVIPLSTSGLIVSSIWKRRAGDMFYASQFAHGLIVPSIWKRRAGDMFYANRFAHEFWSFLHSIFVMVRRGLAVVANVCETADG